MTGQLSEKLLRFFNGLKNKMADHSNTGHKYVRFMNDFGFRASYGGHLGFYGLVFLPVGGPSAPKPAQNRIRRRPDPGGPGIKGSSAPMMRGPSLARLAGAPHQRGCLHLPSCTKGPLIGC